jgi:hypothetical protein
MPHEATQFGSVGPLDRHSVKTSAHPLGGRTCRTNSFNTAPATLIRKFLGRAAGSGDRASPHLCLVREGGFGRFSEVLDLIVAAYNAWDGGSLMAEEDDDLAYWLAREYTRACDEISWNDDGYMAWAERRHAGNHVVNLVWRDDTKRHHIDYDLLKDERPTVGGIRRRVIHCETREKANRLKAMLLASDPFDD